MSVRFFQPAVFPGVEAIQVRLAEGGHNLRNTTMRLSGRSLWTTVIGLILSASNAVAQDRYYAIVFASEGSPNQPRFSHVFATFVKVQEKGPGLDVDLFETATVSWLPATLNIAPLRRTPEQGRNLDLLETLDWARTVNSRVVAWGPFEVRKELYDRAVSQVERLQRGAIGYKMLDVRFRGASASNCIHAVSDIADRELLITGTAFGEPAGRMVARHFQPWITNTAVAPDSLIDRLGIRQHGIVFRPN